MNNHPLIKTVSDYKNGKHSGVFSVCSSNKLVIETAMDKLKGTDMHLLVEATANQVDQFGGYTGMKPIDFKQYMYDLCDVNNFPKDQVILGGDHLGPLTFRNLTTEQAMENSKELVRQYVLAGFTKIHIDTSMPLKEDMEQNSFSDDVIADRAGILCKVCEEAYVELLKQDKNAVHPVYVIGSEVPVPGGVNMEELHDQIAVTKVADFEGTLNAFKKSFEKHGVSDSFKYVIGVVVQPGVEFGTDTIWDYNADNAKDLSNAIKAYDNIVFEAHSTDYQTKYALRQLVEDGFIILKVGPALTFAFREAVFTLNIIEEELLKNNPDVDLSKFKEILDFVMIKDKKQWVNHYSGTGEEIKIQRKYSLSDRARYYLGNEQVEFAFSHLMSNLSDINIPITLLSQYAHGQYVKVRENKIENNAESILKDIIGEVMDDYIYAIK